MCKTVESEDSPTVNTDCYKCNCYCRSNIVLGRKKLIYLSRRVENRKTQSSQCIFVNGKGGFGSLPCSIYLFESESTIARPNIYTTFIYIIGYMMVLQRIHSSIKVENSMMALLSVLFAVVLVVVAAEQVKYYVWFCFYKFVLRIRYLQQKCCFNHIF